MRAMSEIVRDLDAAAGTIEVVCRLIESGDFDPNEAIAQLTFADTDVTIAVDELRGLAGGTS